MTADEPTHGGRSNKMRGTQMMVNIIYHHWAKKQGVGYEKISQKIVAEAESLGATG